MPQQAKLSMRKEEYTVKRVITFGVFDYFHLGHLRLFKHAKALGDYLIVAVQDGDSILKTKPDATVFYSTAQRIELVKALRMVDEVILYQDVDRTLPQLDFDVFAIGSDQTHPGFQRAVRWCEENGKAVVRLARTPGICSSSIKRQIDSLE